MRIHMIGAGAMGGFYGGLLFKSGYDVTLVDPREDHIGLIRRQGIKVEGVRGEYVIKVPAQTNLAGLPKADLAIIFSDTNATPEAARTAAQTLTPEGFALTLQNGIGNVEALVAELGQDRVAAGVTMNSGAHPEIGRVIYTNAGMTSLGELNGTVTSRIELIAEMLNKAQIPTEVITNPIAQIWTKFVLNCGVNALTALTGLRAGEIYRTPEVKALQGKVIDEILLVVARKGITLLETDPKKKIIDHCRLRYNKPSMMQHIEQGRRTEIDSINGALVREGNALGLSLPYNETIVALIKGLEKSRHQLLHEAPRDYGQLEKAAAAEPHA
jgi:2-dehydropantoate 2-reductase